MSQQTIDVSDVDIHGKENIVGSYNTMYILEQQKEGTSFFKPNLEHFESPTFVPPPFLHSIIKQVHERKVIIIGGSPAIDKGAIARNVAWSIFKDGWSVVDFSEDDRPLKEWVEGADRRSLDIALRAESKPTVFILPQLLPQHINYDPAHLKRIADTGKHKIIASSDVAVDVWKLSNHETSIFWHEVSLSDFTTDYLTNVLRQYLLEAGDRLPISLLNQDWTLCDHLAEGVSLHKVAKTLQTPNNIAVFIDFLCIEKPPDSDTIWQLVNRVQDHKAALRQWYYKLKPRQQLLTVALSFFDGLFDDQFFSSLDTLVETIWRRRNPLLVSFDYYDLEYLKSVFNFVEAERGGVKIESRSPERRQALLKMAWKSHRRYILSTLPHLAQIAHGSVRNRSDDMELVGTKLKQQQIRWVISQTLTDLGLISMPAIEKTLLKLATDDHPQVQSVAAEAMANLRRYERHDELFSILRRWRQDAELLEVIDLLVGEKEENKYPALAYIRSTVALAVAYAAAYDRPNQLSPHLLELFVDLSQDTNSLVRHRFVTYTLPLIVEQHWHQLTKILRNMVQVDRLIPSIAVSLSRAYRFNSKGIMHLLNNWQAECSHLPARLGHLEPQWRERLLATVALTYGLIPYGQRIGFLAPEEGFRKLEAILTNEGEHPFVRIAVVRAISIQANERFDEIEPYLRHLVATLQPNERKQIVDIVTNVYLSQRADLRGGDVAIRFKDKRHQLWLESKRPLTEVEESMYLWVEQSKNTAAQQIGLQAFVAFAQVFDLHEAKEILRIKKEREDVEDEISEPDSSQPPTKPIGSEMITRRRLGLQASIALWFVTVGQEKVVQDIIRGLFPEALHQSRRNRSRYRFVLEEWQRELNLDHIPEIARLLKRVDRLANSELILIVGIVGVFLLCFLLYSL